MKLTGLHISHGRYYKVVSNPGGKKWIPLSRVSEGNSALMHALDGLDQAPHIGAMQRAIDDYLKHHRPTLTPAVRKEHERMFAIIAAAFAEFTVDAIKPRHCLEFLNAFAQHPTARQSYKYRMSAFFGWCVVQELCETNPLREIKVAGPPKHKTIWSDALFIACRAQMEPMMQCYHDLSFLLLQRTTDVRHLERRQIVHDTAIHFTPSKTAGSSGASVSVTITPDIRAVLDRAADLSRTANVISPYVIHTSGGDSYTRSGIYSAYRRADTALHQGKPIGLNAKDIRPAATCAEAQGHSLRAIQRRLAHATQGTTEGYIHQHDMPVSDLALRLPGSQQ